MGRPLCVYVMNTTVNQTIVSNASSANDESLKLMQMIALGLVCLGLVGALIGGIVAFIKFVVLGKPALPKISGNGCQ